MSGEVMADWVDVTTVGDAVVKAAASFPDNDAVVFPGERVTYAQLAERVDGYAKSLLALGVRRHDKVGLLLPQDVEYLAVMLAVAAIGAVAVPINARYKAQELAHVFVKSDMAVLLTSDAGAEFVDYPALVSEALPSLAAASSPALALAEAPMLRCVVMMGGRAAPWFLPRSAFLAGAASVTDASLRHRRLATRLRDTAFVIFTSGTTAHPKGAMLSHEALVRHGAVVCRSRFELTGADRMWTALPLFHIGGAAFLFACMSAGATYVHTGQFEPGAAVRQLGEERCTVAIPAFETIWLAMLDHATFPEVDVSSLRFVFNIGVPERLRGMQERIPTAPQVSGFGATEASSFLTLGVPTDPFDERVTTAGRPLPGLEVRIVDPETGRDCPPGALGEIVYRGWSVFDGYINDPERTAEVLDRDGWFRSGDMGTLDERGCLTFVTRLKDMLKVGGENVAAAEVEDLLLGHPAVLMVQVVSAPDARYTEVPAAFVQLKPGASATEQELIEHCLGRIATLKVPRYVRFVDAWPMSGTKVQKYRLREQIAAELAERQITEAPKLTSPR